jgi:hypothetical protein
MKLKKMQREAQAIAWPETSNDLPVITWDECELHSSFLVSALICLLDRIRHSPRNLQDSKVNRCFRIRTRRREVR